MLAIPSYVYLIGAFIAWAGLMLTWAKHIHDIAEGRRMEAVAKGETPPEVKGVSNYERAEIREMAHRAQHITVTEKWIGRGLASAIPVLILTVYITSAQA
jgi:hypothetical protein